LAKKLQAEQTTNQMTERMLKSNTALQEMDRDTLIRLLNQLRDALNASEGEKVQLQAVLRSAKTSIDEFAVMKRDYRELQVAHTEQTRYLQKMQTKINQADVYRGTIATQEGVIASMQSAIEAKIHKHRGLDRQLLLPRPPKRPPVDDNSINTTERSAVESKLHEASQQVSTLEQRVRELEEQLELAKYAHVEEEEDDTQDETGQESSDEDENEEEEEEEAKKGGDQSLETDRKIDQLEAEVRQIELFNTFKKYCCSRSLHSWCPRASASLRWRNSWRRPRWIIHGRLLVCARSCSSWKSTARSWPATQMVPFWIFWRMTTTPATVVAGEAVCRTTGEIHRLGRWVHHHHHHQQQLGWQTR
jgi:hypothetical protein